MAEIMVIEWCFFLFCENGLGWRGRVKVYDGEGERRTSLTIEDVRAQL